MENVKKRAEITVISKIIRLVIINQVVIFVYFIGLLIIIIRGVF